MKPSPIVVYPSNVPTNARITIRASTDHFPENMYLITDESGKVIRKGSISTGMKEFCLSVVGMMPGCYRLYVGNVQEKFTVL